VHNSGCPSGSGLACYSNGASTECACPGSRAAGDDCLGTADCMPGYGCIGVVVTPGMAQKNTCKKLCNTQVDCGLAGVCTTYGTFSYCQ